MARRYVRIGSLDNVHVYDDAVFSGGVETDDVIKAGAAPVVGVDVLRLDDVGGIVGDVVGPAGSTDHALVRWDGASGKLIQDSGAILTDSDHLGLGIAPTAVLHLKAGTAAASTAPLKFTSGVLLAAPEAGVMEFDGTGVYLTPTNHRRFISLASDSIIATVTATTVALTTIWTGITNANELKPYRVYLIKGCGLVNNQAAANQVTINVSIAATVLITITTPVVGLTNDPWDFEVYITIRTTGVAGTISAYGRMLASTTIVNTSTESVVVDTTIANNITVSVSWSVAHANNWLKLTQCWLAVAD